MLLARLPFVYVRGVFPWKDLNVVGHDFSIFGRRQSHFCYKRTLREDNNEICGGKRREEVNSLEFHKIV